MHRCLHWHCGQREHPTQPETDFSNVQSKASKVQVQTLAQDNKYHTHVNNGHAQPQGHTQAHGVRSSRSTCRITEYCFFNAFASSLFLNIELHVNELKDKLRAGRLPVSGKKADLVERLMNPPASRPSFSESEEEFYTGNPLLRPQFYASLIGTIC